METAPEQAEPSGEDAPEKAIDIPLGEEYGSQEGGYSFDTIPGYDVEEFFGFGSMTAPDDDEVGIIFVGGLPEQEDLTLNGLYDDAIGEIESDAEDVQITNKRSITVDGVSGYSVDIRGTVEGEDVAGRIVVVVVSPEQEFRMVGYAPQDRWDSELDTYFEAVLATVQFFEPTETEFGFEEEKEYAAGEIRQWASTAAASSEWGNPGWAAVQATGAPDTIIDECEDATTAWASAGSDTVEWIELGYDTSVIPTEINIIQTHSPDQVVQVEVIDTQGGYHTVYTGTPENLWEQCPYTLAIPIEVDYEANGIKITIDQSVINATWNEIDAVELVGHSAGEAISSAPSETGTTEGVLWRAGGERGTEDGQIGGVDGMYATAEGLVYIADETFGVRVHDAENGSLVALISHNDLWQPSDVEVGPDGNIYVADWGANKVFIFSPDGDLVNQFGEDGNGPGQFGTFTPDTLALGADGEIFIFDDNTTDTDEEFMRIQVFSSEGTFSREFPIELEGLSIEAIDIGPDGNLYLVDWFGDVILEYSPDGTFIREIGEDALYFASPQDIAIDKAGNFYVAVWSPEGVIKLDPSGNKVVQFGTDVDDGEKPWPEGEFYSISGVAVTPDGSHVFASDWSSYYAYITAFEFK